MPSIFHPSQDIICIICMCVCARMTKFCLCLYVYSFHAYDVLDYWVFFFLLQPISAKQFGEELFTLAHSFMAKEHALGALSVVAA